MDKLKNHYISFNNVFVFNKFIHRVYLNINIQINSMHSNKHWFFFTKMLMLMFLRNFVI